MGAISENPAFPVLPIDEILPGSELGVLEISHDDVDQTVQEVLLQLPLGESPTRADSEFPTGSPSQLPTSLSNPPTISGVPDQDQRGNDDPLSDSPIDVPASTSETGAKPSSLASETF